MPRQSRRDAPEPARGTAAAGERRTDTTEDGNEGTPPAAGSTDWPDDDGAHPAPGTASTTPAGGDVDRDPLEHPDTAAAADAATTENLLRCWIRENDGPRPENGRLRLPLDAAGTALLVPVRHWSDTGWHRFGPPRLENAPEGAAPADAVLVATLIGREAAHRAGAAEHGGGAGLAETAALAGRVADSVQRTASFLTARRAEPGRRPECGPFLDAEQSLLLGHPLHPTAKSREGLSEAEARVYSPELRSSFALHWMAVSRTVLAQDSAWTEQGRVRTAETLARRFAGPEVTARLPEDTVPLPLHPWQARELRQRPGTARLLELGLLRDLGEGGDPWHPTSSVRTVLQSGATPSAMLKLSLGVRITNSRRENLRKELLRGLEVHRLLRSGLATQWRSVHPGFDIVRDAAWIGADDDRDGTPVPGLDTVIRHNPFGPGDDAVCVAGLTSPRPWPGTGEGVLRSRLADVVTRLSARTRRPVTEVSAEWFLRYLDAVVRPVLWLDAHAGIALEAHQQNTVVLLDAEGWPEGGRYRDNQGYYFRTSHRAELERRLPGARLGVASDSFVEDAVVDERFAYYLGINNVLGLIGAFGSQGLADERLLLAAFRDFLRKSAKCPDGGPVSPLPSLLLDTPTLNCKANLLTRLHGLDELVGPVDTQSVYVDVTNPLVC
ncbi:iron transporter [Streptomyces sp. HNM0574]|nr:iron transporter [Streptomyces sp. HNM0574]